MEQPLFLKIYKGKDLIQVKQFLQEQIVMGRNSDVDLTLDDESISPVHAVIEEREGGYFLCDMGSKGGVKKNGQVVLDESIGSGDFIELGPYRIEFHVGIPTPKKKPPKVVPHPTEVSETKKNLEKEDAKSSSESEEEKTFSGEESEETVTDFSVNKLDVEKKSKSKKEVKKAEPKGLKIKPQQKVKSNVPPSASTYKGDVVLPESGTTLEIVVAWENRILSSYHINEKTTVRMGSHPKNDVIVPVFGGGSVSHPLVQMDSLAEIFLTSDMEGEWTSGKEKRKFRDLIQTDSVKASGGGYTLTLQQGEMLRINLDGGVSVYVRYVSTAPKPLVGPFFDFSSSELTSFVMMLIIVGLFSLYMSVYTSPVIEEEPEPEKKRVATFQYKHPQPIKPMSDPPKRVTVGKAKVSPDKKKVRKKAPAKKITKKRVTKKKARKRRSKKGKASAAAPNRSKSRTKKLTTPNPGRGKGIRRGQRTGKVRGGGGAKQKDVRDTGLLSVFGTKGTQDQLQKALQGSDAVSGLSQGATGSGSTKAAGAGTDIGQGLKDLGQGGSGVSTVGISGVKTKGIGGGDSGYGLDASGSGKRSVTIEAGGGEEEFVGSIDKEAVRRVIQRGLNQIKTCYERALNRNPGLRGKVVLKWSIVERGRVRNAQVVGRRSTLKNQSVSRCMISRLRTWRFPEPPIGTYADITYPFVFTH